MDEDISLEEIEKKYSDTGTEVIPEAIMWKQTILRLQIFAGIARASYYSEFGKGRMDTWTRYQGMIIALYTMLKVKLKDKEKEELKGLDVYMKSASEISKRAELVKVDYLNRCLDILNEVSERIGITHPEKKRLPEGASMA